MRLGLRSAAILLVITALCAACVPSALPLDTATPTETPVTVELTAITLLTPPVSTAATAEPSVESSAALPLIAAGAGHTCLVNDKGAVACWGDNQFGQLGGGSGPFRLLEFGPEVEGLTNWIYADVTLDQPVAAIAAGFYHTCAVRADGQVWCWGSNSKGELGNNSTEDSPSPVNVKGLAGPVVALSAGAVHTCALLEDGTVQCWGDNSNGQLGNDAATVTRVPVTVSGLNGAAKQIAVGVAFSCALMEAGNVSCWGSGAGGLFGDGAPDEVIPPTSLDLADRVDRLVAGHYHLCAVLESGAVTCWGLLNSEEDFSPANPMRMSGLGDQVTMMSAGGGFTCALTSVGGVKCWGDNYFGQLGDRSDLASWQPVDSSGLASGAVSVAAGSGHACAALASGSLRCWGDASAGQLGDRVIRWLADWNTYTNEKYGFSIDFPAGWKVLDVPNETYLTDVEQVWFATDEFPPPQTGARPDVAITVTTEDPLPAWQPKFFDEYRATMVRTNGIEATYISGINREMGGEERVVIINLKSGIYLQIAPNGSPQSLLVFDPMVASIKE